MNQRTKKQLIAGLLLISCIISGWWLFLTPAPDGRSLQRLARADSLLHLTLTDFSIARQQVDSRTVRIDSTFARTTYTVAVPPGFSKTQFHAVLQQRLAPYGVSLPARVVFPERDMYIYLNYRNTIIRTVQLVTDEELRMQRSFASIIVAFRGRPSDARLQMLTSFGEPIPAAVILRPPYTVPGWWDAVREQYSPVYLWPQTASGGNLLSEAAGMRAGAALEPIAEALPSATLISFSATAGSYPSSYEGTDYQYVNARHALIFNEEMSRPEFSQAFRTFADQARRGAHPLALVIASEKTLDWTRDELSIFNRGGLYLTLPPHVQP